jgi:TolA-binding protein
VSGHATADEAAAFEEHYVTCAVCQNEVLLAAAIREQATALPVRTKRPRMAWTVASLLAAATLAGVLLMKQADARRWTRLGAIDQPPAYGGVAVRAQINETDSLFAQAMHRYREGDYRGAASGLRAVLQADNPPVAADFYLGASLLQQDDARAAAAAFRRVLARGASIYTDEARYYNAKALLRLGQPDAAISSLRAVDSTSPISAAARALADSIR